MRRGIRLKYIKRVGRYTYYSRPGRKLVRLPDLPENDPVFLAAYTAAAETAPKVASVRAPAPETLAALVVAYRRSDEFRIKSATTKATRIRIMDKLVAKGGHAIVAGLTPRHIRNDLSDMLPHAANTRLKVWRALIAFAVEPLGWIESSPARQVRPRPATTDGHREWTTDEIEKFREHHSTGTKARLAFELLHWTAARRGDVVRLGWQFVGNDGWLTFTQEKTGGPVSIPFTCSLPDWMAPLAEDHAHLLACLESMPAGQMLFLEARGGRAHSPKAFRR